MKHTISILTLCFIAYTASAIVKYDEGRLQINGIQLLQDREDSEAYYYLPSYPRIATDDAGQLHLLCIKYVGQGGAKTNGGIFHALLRFDLPAEELEELQKELKKQKPSARIAGPVPLRQAKDEDNGIAEFRVVSSILNDTGGSDPFTNTMVTSGHAPLLPGSKAAIAAKLSQEGITLLWNSFQGPTSDVSVAVQGYYEAAVKGYNAVVTADMSTVYKHFSMLDNQQKLHSREQIRKVTDELVQTQAIKIDVFDRSESLDINSGDLEGILNIVTTKLTDLMFNTESGWAKLPPTEASVAEGQIPGKRKKGIMGKIFGRARDTRYITDNQFALKEQENIRNNKFYLNLSKSTSIQVPFYATGNIGGTFFDALKEDKRYFRVVNMDDPDFQKREIFFQIDGNFVDAFNDILNFASITFKKSYNGKHEDVTCDLMFNQDQLQKGNILSATYPRLGQTGDNWLAYDYKLTWSLKGDTAVIRAPFSTTQWLSSNEQAIPLSLPFTKETLTIDADRQLFKEKNIHTATVQFYVILNGKPRKQRSLLLQNSDPQNTSKTSLYHDPNEPMIYQVTWYAKDGTSSNTKAQLKDDYLLLVPPDM